MNILATVVRTDIPGTWNLKHLLIDPDAWSMLGVVLGVMAFVPLAWILFGLGFRKKK